MKGIQLSLVSVGAVVVAVRLVTSSWINPYLEFNITFKHFLSIS